MSKYLGRRIILHVVLVLLAVVPVLCLTAVPALRPAVFMARYLGRQLDSVPDPLVAAHLRRVGDLGNAGLELLVEALGSHRAVVSGAAGRELHVQLDRWAALPASESSPKVARLVALLASRVNQWEAPARSVAADLANQVLRWPLQGSRVRRVELIADCETVLRSVADVGPLPHTRAVTAPESVAGRAVAVSHASVDPTGLQGLLNLPMTDEVGGGLPIEEVEIPPFPPSLVDPLGPRSVDGEEPRLVPPTGQRLPYILFPENEGPMDEPVPAHPVSPIPRQLDPQLEPQRPLQKEAEPMQLTSTAVNRLDGELEQLPDLDLIRRLSDPRPWMSAAVQDQLERRGFGAQELNLARIVASPDPAKRRQLAASLNRLTTSPSRWLFWLSYDPDPSVRHDAVAMMATSQDPRLLRRLRELLSTELDGEVRELLSTWYDSTAKQR